MNTPNPRVAKLADQIRVVVAETLERRVKDPRLGFVTITDARVTNDLQHATVYYTVLGDEATVAAAHEGIQENRGILRREVGRGLTIRLVPTLEFVADEIPEAASNLEDVLRRAKEKDAAVAASAAGATYANGENSYRTDEADDAQSAAAEADDEDPSGTRER